MKSSCLKSFASGLVALASVLCTERALATDVSGTLSSDTVWSASGSPYVVTGTVLVSSGVSVAEWIHREFQCAAKGGVPESRRVMDPDRGASSD